MKALPSNSTVPWQVSVFPGFPVTGAALISTRLRQQRVIASNGYISPRADSGLGADRQMERLRDEGVEVVDMGGNGVVVNGRGGRYRVSIAQFGWFPEGLP